MTSAAADAIAEDDVDGVGDEVGACRMGSVWWTVQDHSHFECIGEHSGCAMHRENSGCADSSDANKIQNEGGSAEDGLQNLCSSMVMPVRSVHHKGIRIRKKESKVAHIRIIHRPRQRLTATPVPAAVRARYGGRLRSITWKVVVLGGCTEWNVAAGIRTFCSRKFGLRVPTQPSNMKHVRSLEIEACNHDTHTHTHTHTHPHTPTHTYTHAHTYKHLHTPTHRRRATQLS
jgi:hypothetical protein